jgi:hypothetical protein
VKWDTGTDSFIFNLNLDDKLGSLEVGTLTPRQILSTICTIFDPLGILAHVTLIPRLMMQEIWRQKLGWDDVVPQESGTTFIEWLENLKIVEQLRFPRFYLEPNWSVQFSVSSRHF